MKCAHSSCVNGNIKDEGNKNMKTRWVVKYSIMDDNYFNPKWYRSQRTFKSESEAQTFATSLKSNSSIGRITITIK